MSDDATIDQPSPQSPPAPNELTIAEATGMPAAGSKEDATIDQPAPSDETGAWQSTPGAENTDFSVGGVTGSTEALTGAWAADSSGTHEATGEYRATHDGTIDHDESQRLRQAAVDRAALTGKKATPPGESIGRFLLKKFHAKGGMGEVWIAEDTDIGRVVALKKIRTGREPQIDKFLHEAQITGQLEHPGVIPVHELGVVGGQPYYVMKFVHGRTMKEAIDDYHNKELKSPVPREVQFLELVQVFINLCQTVAYAHSRNVIHRDIKPDNVMVGQYGETLVLDWGLAKIIGEGGGTETMPEIHISGVGGTGETEQTLYGSIKGTPSYMSPEVAEGDTAAVDQISDVYLLGGCLYHLLTGKKPRQASKVSEMIELAKKQLPPAPRSLDRTIPRALDAICMKSLALKKEDRYQSAQALAKDVQRWLAGEPVEAYHENLTERAWRWMRKHRVGIGRGVIVAIVLALLGGGGWLLAEAEAQRQADLKEAEDKRLADIAGSEAKRIADAAKAAREKAALEKQQQDAQASADKLSRERQASKDRTRFQRLAEESQFLHVMYDNAADKEPLYDRETTLARGNAALESLQMWGVDLGGWPFPNEQGEVRKEVYELLLRLVQIMLIADNRVETAREAKTLLDRAEGLHQPTVGYYRLRARSYRILGDVAKAADAQQQVDRNRPPAGAVDLYLQADALLDLALRAQVSDDAAKASVDRQQFAGQAIQQYYEALKLDPEYYLAYWQMGRCFSLLGKKLEAAQAMASCAALKAQSPSGYALRGLALFTMNRDAEALANLDNAIKEDPNFRPARLHRAVIEWLLKQYPAAESDFEAVLAPPDELKLLPAAYYRGQMSQERKEYRAALADFDMVLAGPHPLRDAYLRRAQVCLMLDLPPAERRKAIEDGLKAIDSYLRAGRTKDLPAAETHELSGHELFQFAVTPAAKAKRKEILQIALAEFEKAVGEKRRTASLYHDMGFVQMLLGKVTTAIASYTDALKIDPKDVKVLVKRGVAWENLKDPNHEAALKDFAEVVRLDPTHGEAHSWLAYCHACLKNIDEALEQANLANLWADDYRILHNVACAYSKLSELEKERQATYEDMAIDQLRRGIELWKLQKTGTDPRLQMQNEPAFTESLKRRAGFVKLLEKDK
jgi:tetratricopeptide (TPR) repeat protein/tRNA A-37 threonylcarbamoyl transferase component Bud32